MLSANQHGEIFARILLGDEKPNFGICGTVFKELFKDIDAKTETAASSENSGRKSTENEQLEVLYYYKHTICSGFPNYARA